MANISLSITLVILLCGLTLASRTKILPLSSTVTALAPELSDGVCSSLVKTQGYACEEHLVCTLQHCFHLFLFFIRNQQVLEKFSRF